MDHHILMVKTFCYNYICENFAPEGFIFKSWMSKELFLVVSGDLNEARMRFMTDKYGIYATVDGSNSLG